MRTLLPPLGKEKINKKKPPSNVTGLQIIQVEGFRKWLLSSFKVKIYRIFLPLFANTIHKEKDTRCSCNRSNKSIELQDPWLATENLRALPLGIITFWNFYLVCFATVNKNHYERLFGVFIFKLWSNFTHCFGVSIV